LFFVLKKISSCETILMQLVHMREERGRFLVNLDFRDQHWKVSAKCHW